MEYIIKTWPTWATLAGFLAAAMGAASTGQFFMPGAWYRSLKKPVWTPPNWLFPIAWTFLYIAMAVAAWWVTLSPSGLVGLAIALWAWQIAMNAVWTPVFFGLRRLGAGLVVILLLWLSVALSTWVFWQVDDFAGWLMLPYLVWVSYAAMLNLALWRMNPDAVPLALPDQV